MKPLNRNLLTLGVLLLGTLALGQMSGLPSSATYTIYQVDAGPQYWFDAGASIYTPETITGPDGGVALKLGGFLGVKAQDEATFPAGLTGGLLYGTDAGSLYVYKGTSWQPVGGGADSFWADGGSSSMYAKATVSNPDGGTGITFSTASGAVAASMGTGARLDFGAGTSDYAASDGTGIETPSYWESTRAFSAGPGVIANSGLFAGASASGFTSAAGTASGQGTIAFNTTEARLYVQNGLPAWAPLGQPHVVFDRQYWTTRVGPLVGDNLTWPQFAENFVIDDPSPPASVVLRMHWSEGPQQNVRKGLRWFYPLTTGASSGDKESGFSVASDLLTTFYPMVETNSLPSMCQRIYTGSTVSNVSYIIGLVRESGGAPDAELGGSAYIAFSAASPKFQLTVYDAVDAKYSYDTGVTVAANKGYTVCVYYGDGSPYAVINGVFAVASAVEAKKNVKLGPYVYIENTANDAVKSLFVGPMQVEAL